MNKYFVDTNLFLRYLTNDIPDKAKKFETLIRRSLSNEIILITNSLVFAEIIWTLESFYKYSKKEIDNIVSSLIASKAFELEEREILLQALEDYHSLNIDFVDAYIASWMEKRGIENIYTYNQKHFKKFNQITALQP